ncbi:MAG: MFS transporter [Candidatus Nanohaloarchaea archaeon]
MEKSEVIQTLFITVVAEVISFGVIIPLVPLLFTEPSSKFYILSQAASQGMGYVLLGVTIGLYPLAQFLSTPLLGELSDVYGRKSVMQLSVLGTVVASVVFALGIMMESVAVLFASRFVNGLTGGLISVGQATIADVSEESEKSRGFGLLGAAFGLGFMFGPFLGGLLSSDMMAVFGASTPLWFAAGLSTLSLMFITWRLEETSPMEKSKIRWTKPFSQLRKGLAIPGIRKLLGANFFYFSGFAFFTTFVPVFLVERFGFSQVQTGGFFFYIGVLSIIGQGYIVPKGLDRFREERVMPVALFLTGFFIFLQPLSPVFLVFIAAVTLFSLSNSFTTISLNTLVSKKSPDRDQGLALGTNQSLRALGNAGPSMLSGVAAAVLAAQAPLFIAGIIIMSAAIGYHVLEQ